MADSSAIQNHASFSVERLGSNAGERYKTIRLAALAESPDAFGSTFEQEREFSDERWHERLANTNTATFVATIDGKDVGLVTGIRHWDQPGEAALASMWVAPDYRRLGVGAALIESAIAWAQTQRYTAVRLEVADENAPAIAFYERMGFTATGRVSTLPPPRQHITEHERMRRLS
jgi:ribosomal protein S18 acetylase RimI-like enzyme